MQPKRTVVLLREVNSRNEQVTNSNMDEGLWNSFPQDQQVVMPAFLDHQGQRYDLLDKIAHEEDHPGHELYHYLLTT